MTSSKTPASPTKNFEAPFNPPKTYACFDFDGTLANTPKGILNTAEKVLRDWGLTDEEMGDLNRLIGPPFPEAFEMVYGFSPEDAAAVTQNYRDIYFKLGPEYFPAYEGVKEMLQALKDAGVKIALTTSKQQELAVRMSKTLSILDYFDVIAGNVGNHGDKAELVRLSLERFGLDPEDPSDLKKACMVGDRSYDILGAKANGLDSIGVTYGAGSEEELLEAGATRIAKSPLQVAEVILGRR